jgi:hypothetical protein
MNVSNNINGNAVGSEAVTVLKDVGQAIWQMLTVISSLYIRQISSCYNYVYLWFYSMAIIASMGTTILT